MQADCIVGLSEKCFNWSLHTQ